jgi:hypothetical protein
VPDAFRGFLKEVKPIRFKEPLAETLGAFTDGDAVLDYTFIETVKMAGHACPTVSGAYLVCQKALEALYPGEIPVRGQIAVIVYGRPDEGVNGVMGQVFTFLTGAAPASGFCGLGGKFGRKDLLSFSPNPPDPQAMCFEFKRLDTGRAVLARFYPRRIPQSGEGAARMAGLFEKVLWEADGDGERAEFQDLWMRKVRDMLIEQKEIDNWLKVQPIG